METEGSLPFSQKPPTGPYPEPYESNPQLTPYFPKIHSNIIVPSKTRSTFCMKLFHPCVLTPRPSHPPWFGHPIIIWW